MNTNQEDRCLYFNIENGPSIEALFNACRYAYDPNGTVHVGFKVAVAYTCTKNNVSGYIAMQLKDIRITSIEHEDGSGYRFNLCGYCKADLNTLNAEKAVFKSYRFEAFYNAKTRRGNIYFPQ